MGWLIAYVIGIVVTFLFAWYATVESRPDVVRDTGPNRAAVLLFVASIGWPVLLVCVAVSMIRNPDWEEGDDD